MASMSRMALAVVVALATGCSTHVNLGVSSGGGAVASGTQVTTGTAGLRIQSDSLAAVVVTGMFIAATIDYAREPQPFPSFSEFYDWRGGTPAPPLAPERRVHEQDCSQPLEDPSANLKCR
jgi:hypothetical protein